MSSQVSQPVGNRPSEPSGWLRFLAAVTGVAGVFLAIAVALGPFAEGSAWRGSAKQLVKPTAVRAERGSGEDSDGYPNPSDLSRAFARVAEQVGPAVVNITTQQEARSDFQHPRTGGPFDDFFERFFGGPIPQQRRTSLGSGVIVDPQGYIITNNHVIERADEIEVQLSDDKVFQATVVGSDPETDMAVIKIESEDTLPYASLGDSDAMAVGEWVLAMGNPFGFGHSITAGIISAKDRIIGAGSYDDFLQTDAAINPGNSGGPLLNMEGQVSGINSNIVSSSGGNIGIGFAVPSNLARNIYNQLVESGSVTRGWLGVSIQNLSPQLARGFGLEGQKGAIVADVLGEDSPAAKAGLKAGDIIVEIEGQPIESNNHLVRIVADLLPGAAVEVKYYRDGQIESTRVTLGKRSDNLADQSGGVPQESERGRLGITAQDLTEQLASQMGVTSQDGVILVSVDSDGPAAEAGLQRGDIIIEANRQRIRGVEDLERVMGQIPDGGDLLLRIERLARGQSSMLWIPVELQ
jgi:serine protease Do